MIIYLLVAIVVILVVYYWRYPKFGLWLYRMTNALESKLGGFRTDNVDINGITYHYLHNPGGQDKPSMLLVHGFSADKSIWLKMARKLRHDYHIIIPDLAGHGETGFSQHWDYGIAAQAQRLLTLMDRLGISKAHLVGNSMGGFICAHLCSLYPQRAASLILINSAGIKSSEPSTMNKMIAGGNNPFLMESASQFEAFYNMTMAKPPFVPKIVKQALALAYVRRRPQLEQIFKEFNHPDAMLDGKLEQINVPTLVLWGAQDQLIHVSAANIWQQGTAGQLVVWRDLGHMPMAEAPARTAQQISQFIAQLH